jgi:hypothetical protein
MERGERRVPLTFLSVVVPVFNEEDRVNETISRVSRYLSATFPDHEIIAVDDGSTDRSGAILGRLVGVIPQLRVVRYLPNQGKGVAVRAGLKAASGQWIALVDADLELPIELLQKFFQVQRETSAKVVVGSKRHPLSVVEYPKVRAKLSRAYGLGIRLLFGLPVRDTQVGFKLLDRQSVMKIAPRLVAKRYAFDVELLVLLDRHGSSIAEAPIRLRFSRAGSGRIRFRTIANMVRETAGIWYRLYVTGFYAPGGRRRRVRPPPRPEEPTHPATVPAPVAGRFSNEVQTRGRPARGDEAAHPFGRQAAEGGQILAVGSLEGEPHRGLGVRGPDMAEAERDFDLESVDGLPGTTRSSPSEGLERLVSLGEPPKGQGTARSKNRTNLLPHPLDRPNVCRQETRESDRDPYPVRALVLPPEVDVGRGLHTHLRLRSPHRFDHESSPHSRALDTGELLEALRGINARDQDPPAPRSLTVEQQSDQFRFEVDAVAVHKEDPVPIPVERSPEGPPVPSDLSTQKRQIGRSRFGGATKEVRGELIINRDHAGSHSTKRTNHQSRCRAPAGIHHDRPLHPGTLSNPA